MDKKKKPGKSTRKVSFSEKLLQNPHANGLFIPSDLNPAELAGMFSSRSEYNRRKRIRDKMIKNGKSGLGLTNRNLNRRAGIIGNKRLTARPVTAGSGSRRRVYPSTGVYPFSSSNQTRRPGRVPLTSQSNANRSLREGFAWEAIARAPQTEADAAEEAEAEAEYKRAANVSEALIEIEDLRRNYRSKRDNALRFGGSYEQEAKEAEAELLGYYSGLDTHVMYRILELMNEELSVLKHKEGLHAKHINDIVEPWIQAGHNNSEKARRRRETSTHMEGLEQAKKKTANLTKEIEPFIRIYRERVPAPPSFPFGGGGGGGGGP